MILHVARPELLIHFEHKVYDVLLSQTGRRAPSAVPVLIAIDDKSLAAFGQWPWPRNILGRLISRLRQAGADVTALDLILSTRDRTSPLLVLKDLGLESSLDLDETARTSLDHDHTLAEALKEMPTVLGYKLLFSPLHGTETACHIHPILSGQVPPSTFSLHMAQDFVCSLTILGKAAVNSGFINALPDSDGVIRRIPLIAMHGETILPNLTLATLMTRGENTIGLGQDADGAFVQLGRNRTHIDAQGNMLLRYRGPSQTFPTFSAADIMDGALPDLKGRVAIVGPTASGLGGQPCDSHGPCLSRHRDPRHHARQPDPGRSPDPPCLGHRGGSMRHRGCRPSVKPADDVRRAIGLRCRADLRGGGALERRPVAS